MALHLSTKRSSGTLIINYTFVFYPPFVPLEQMPSRRGEMLVEKRIKSIEINVPKEHFVSSLSFYIHYSIFDLHFKPLGKQRHTTLHHFLITKQQIPPALLPPVVPISPLPFLFPVKIVLPNQIPPLRI